MKEEKKGREKTRIKGSFLNIIKAAAKDANKKSKKKEK
jgi:hypothetical protein